MSGDAPGVDPAPDVAPELDGALELENVGALGPMLRDMRQALRSELGAYSLYSLLPKVVRDAELRALLAVLRSDASATVTEVADLMAELGGKPERSRWTRSVVAWSLTLATPLSGVRFPLRLCQEAESTVSRWYAEYATALLRFGDTERAQRFVDLSMRKRIHAVRLSTFVQNLSFKR